MNITDEIIDLVFSSKRALPAHFTSNGDRTKSFCVDYDIASEDEYEIASQAYYMLWEFLAKVPDEISKSDANSVLKIGEDIVLGAYMLQKMDEYASFSDLQKKTIIKNMNLSDSTSLKNALDIPLVQNYFDFCGWFGRSRANGFSWGHKQVANT